MCCIRPIAPEDFDQIDAIGTDNYPDAYYESPASWQSKIAGYPSGAWVCDVNNQVAGYVISFPYVLGAAYPINVEYAPVLMPNCYYIHDLCVHKFFRGRGVAQKLVEKALAHSWPLTALMAVNQSETFWRRYGFEPAWSKNYYSLRALYMIRRTKISIER